MSSEPELGFSISVSRRASVDLPDPDSPTMASVLPASSVKDTSVNACTIALRVKRPRRTS
jgi:hypothetical protein